MPKSMTEAFAEAPPVETPDQRRVRELAVKQTPYTNPEIQEALKLLLGERAKDISRTRRPI